MPSTGLIYRKDLKIGLDELQWLQDENDDRERTARVAGMTTYGLVLSRNADGTLDQSWQVHDDDDDGSISVRAAPTNTARPTVAALVDDEGYVAFLDTEAVDTLTLPNDATWYTICVEAQAGQYERGQLVLTAGSAVITGVDTKFTRFAGKTSSGFNRGTRIRIDAGDTAAGNAGTYEIDVVTSDTSITLVSAIPGGNETVGRFTVAGDYFGAPPADPDIHQRVTARFTRRTTVVREPAAGLIPLADVKRDDGGAPKVTIIDRRHQRVYRSAVPEGGETSAVVALVPMTTHDLSGGPPITSRVNVGIGALGTVGVVASSVCAAGVNGLLLLTEDGGNIVACYRDSLFYGYLLDLGTTGGTWAGAQPSVTRLPPGSGFTHGAAYIDSVVLTYRTTTDDGTTWSGATTILDPTTNDALDTCSWPALIRLANGRLLCVVEYWDNSAGHSYITACTSDDHGATWDVNAGQGYTVKVITAPAADAGRPAVSQFADGRIVVAYTINGTGIGLTSSTDAGGHFPGLPGGTSGSCIDNDGTFDSLNSPAIWASPSGQVVVVTHAYIAGSTSSYLVAATVGQNELGWYTMRSEVLLKADVALGANQDLGLSLTQASSGELVLSWIYTVGGGTDDAYLMRLAPAFLPFQEGGANRYRAT